MYTSKMPPCPYEASAGRNVSDGRPGDTIKNNIK
jgi:hypothetical protein